MDGHTSVNGLDRTIFVFDDDRDFRDELFQSLNTAGYRPVCFADRSSLLAAARKRMPLCMVIEIHLRNGSGIGILRELRAQESPVPVLATSRGGDIPTAVSALKLGAADVIRKPLQVSELLVRIDEIARRLEARDSELLLRGLEISQFPGRGLLSDRELQVAEYIFRGTTSKQTAKILGISPRTVEHHRHSIMQKLGARNVGDVLRLLFAASREPS